MSHKGNEKKKNVYLKYLRTISICAVAGGICGAFFTGGLMNSGLDDIVGGFLDWICRNQLVIFCLIAAVSVSSLELILAKVRKTGAAMASAEDEECDILEYENEKAGSMGVIVSNVSNVISILVLSTGYSARYISSRIAESEGRTGSYLTAMVIFMLICLYNGLWQMRYVKFLQKMYPEKKGDPSSMKFQQRWLESCDEAEKEVIYQSSYKAYQFLGKVIPAMLFLSLLCHFIWNTGLMAIFMIGVIWIAMSVSYSRYAIQKRKQKLEK